ncbi:MAG: isoprenyl transferase [Candidatus Neomarinimicrobiota bacterium]|jgi:undecaprenyl diphosphate synthase|nr:MAG: isoprenyl transferase [Candidatus Neomarinimicrobiota bacterium]
MHIGIIMDGNGRWAADKGWPRSFGHRAGAKKVSEIIKYCPELKVKTLTLYAFSTENWKRAAHEVSSLMRLFRGYLQTKYLEVVKNNIKVKFLGDTNPLPKDILLQMKKLETDTKKNNGFFLNIALNYGGRNEIIRSTKKIAKDLLSDKISVDDINETLFSSYLDTSGQKDPDLIIRTAGEMRLSNFLLWQSVYSELYFSNKMWPEFTTQDFEMAVHSFRQRNRKFGYKEYDFKKIV